MKWYMLDKNIDIVVECIISLGLSYAQIGELIDRIREMYYIDNEVIDVIELYMTLENLERNDVTYIFERSGDMIFPPGGRRADCDINILDTSDMMLVARTTLITLENFAKYISSYDADYYKFIVRKIDQIADLD
jgi:hypothetical protein